jgi:DNA-binding transcriptional MerR regulator
VDRWRVEDLAERAALSVDTIRFYQKRRLLPAPVREGRVAWYGPEHLERLARVRELQTQGLTLALIGRVLSGDLDATDAPLAVAVAVAESPEEFLTLAELADRSGVPHALLEAVAREGLLVPRIHDGGERYTSSDVEVVRAGLALLETGFPLSDLLALAREHNETTHDIAEQAVALFDRYVRTPLRASAISDDAKAQQLVEAFRTLLPAVTALVEHHFRRVLLAVAQQHLESVGEEHELAAASVEAARQLETRSSQPGAPT